MSAIYEVSKSLLRRIVPAGLLYQIELPLRKLFSIGYRGDQVKCNICQSKLSGFIKLERGDLLCPVCGSLPRHRRLWVLLQQQTLSGALLHFSPSRPLLRLLRNYPGITYFPSDYEPNPLIKYRFDITDLDSMDDSFSLILCYHVLEHIIDDQKAMTELYRVLQPGGQVLVQTPFKEGSIYEDFSIKSSAERLKHFGQEDHVRIYSIQGLKNRLEKAGFEVDILHFELDKTQNERLGLNPNETVLVCHK